MSETETAERGPVGPVRPGVLVVQHEEDAGPGLVGEHLVRSGSGSTWCVPGGASPSPRTCGGTRGSSSSAGPSAAGTTGPPRGCRGLCAVREAVADEVPLLGICLGGQIVADVLGGSVVTRTRGPELGAVPLRRLEAADADPVLGGVPDGAPAAQWHWDEVDGLPAGAVPLLGGDDCPHQAFRVGPAGWALQFHPEAGAGTVARWAEADDAQVRADGGDPVAVVASVREAEPRLRTVWGAVSEAWGSVALARVGARSGGR
ncbi:type 1 glutamine amidotransferase [Streptomyces narbonensis]